MDFPRLHSSPEAVFLLLWVDTPVRMQSRKFYSGNKRLKTCVQTGQHEKCSRHVHITNSTCWELWACSHSSFCPQKGQTNWDFTQVQCTFHAQIQTSACCRKKDIGLNSEDLNYVSHKFKYLHFTLAKTWGLGSPPPCRRKPSVTLTLHSPSHLQFNQLRIENSTWHMWLGIRGWEWENTVFSSGLVLNPWYETWGYYGQLY